VVVVVVPVIKSDPDCLPRVYMLTSVKKTTHDTIVAAGILHRDVCSEAMDLCLHAGTGFTKNTTCQILEEIPAKASRRSAQRTKGWQNPHP
jgi:hypothetical protein